MLDMQISNLNWMSIKIYWFLVSSWEVIVIFIFIEIEVTFDNFGSQCIDSELW